jgi:hypothetical protein
VSAIPFFCAISRNAPLSVGLPTTTICMVLGLYYITYTFHRWQ